jgi:HIV Tat-specific factor 1
MFTLQELDEDPKALIELKEDVRDECEKLGEVTNVVLFDEEEDGIMSVRFANEEDALKCVTVCPLPKKKPPHTCGPLVNGS